MLTNIGGGKEKKGFKMKKTWTTRNKNNDITIGDKTDG